MKKTGTIPLVFLLGSLCLSMNSLTDVAEEKSTIEASGLIYSEKPTEPRTGPSTDPGTESSAGPGTDSTTDSATDSGKGTGGDTSGTSGSSDTKGNSLQTNAVGTSRWVMVAGVLPLLGSLSLLSKKVLFGDTYVQTSK